MWRKILQIVGFVVAIAFIVTYICFASKLAREHRSQQKVEDIEITVNGGTSTTKFATPDVIYNMLQSEGVALKKELIDKVDVARISDVIAQNGYVQDVDVFVTYSGKACINVTQHAPVVRMLNGGFNSYVMSNGEIFRSPSEAACRVPVVTGGFKPLFPASYEGDVADYYASLQEKEDSKLAELKVEYDTLKARRRSYISKKSRLKKSRRRKLFESQDERKLRLVGINAEIAVYDNRLLALKGDESALDRRKVDVENRKKKLQKSYDDFMNLINFVSRVRNDEFWGAEVVQFVASTTPSGEISLRLVPRSGDFIIEFGTLADREEKLAKLQLFYDKGLSRIGWGVYKTIDVRYDKQVICKK